MAWTSFAASSTLLLSNARRRSWSGVKNSTLIAPKSTLMPTWIRSLLALRSRREQPCRPIWLLCSLKKTLSTSSRKSQQTVLTRHRQMPLHHSPSTPRLYHRTADFKVSTTDPDATAMRLKNGGIHLGYHVHYVADGGKARVILQVLVTPSEVMDNQPMRDLLFRTRFRWKLRPRHVTGDTKYGTIQNIKVLEDAGIRAYVPLPDWEHMTPFFGPSKFTYDAAQDVYVCPQGQPLRPFRTEQKAEKVEYRADAATCNACPLKAQCTSSEQGRQLHRSFHASYLERVKWYHQAPAYQKAMNKRKVWVEPL